jgi:outer membrane protein assembly factor BamB
MKQRISFSSSLFSSTPLCGIVSSLFLASPVLAQSTQPSWGEFHGPGRTNVSPETGLLASWPEGGPRLLWTYGDCGGGYSGASIAAGRIFTAGDFADAEHVIALDANGKFLWKAPNGKAWRGASPGSRSTPTYDSARVYHLNPTGRLACLRAQDGNEVWAVDLHERFGVRHGIWALAESVVIDGNRVLVTPGGKTAMAALDKHTGRTAWTCTSDDDRACFASSVPVTHKGIRMAIALTARWALAVETATGRLLWKHPWPAPYGQTAACPVVSDGHVFIAAGHSQGGALLEMTGDANGVRQAWFRKDLDNCHGGAVLLGGRLYTTGCRLGGKSFFCVDWATGKDVARTAEIPKVALTAADGRLYGLTENGKMLLIEPKADGFRVAGRFSLPRGDGATYSHPAICNGRLYARWGKNLHAFDIKPAAAK